MVGHEPTSLYRYFDKNGVLLYVGITGRGIARNAEHNKTQPWWQYVARQEVDHFRSRDEALSAERITIETYRPPFNQRHNPEWPEVRDAYLALVATNRVPRVTVQAQIKRLGRCLPAHQLDFDGNRWLFSTRPEHRPIVEAFDRDVYGFRLSMYKGKAHISRDDGAFMVSIRGYGHVAPIQRLSFRIVRPGERPLLTMTGIALNLTEGGAIKKASLLPKEAGK